MEDYKKKYEEALERMKSWARGEHPECFSEAQKAAEFIFPELKESEGERIRKWIIDDIRYNMNNEPLNSSEYKKQGEKAIAWLEKQGEQKKPNKNIVEIWKNMRLEVYQQASGNRHEPNCSDDTTKIFSLNDIDEIIEKVGEQTLVDNVEPKFKPADKIEPKFKVGDWVVWDNKISCHIDNIYQGKWSLMYTITDTNNMTRSYSVKGFDNNTHLWTIQDAKPGDVLAAHECVVLFKEIDGLNIKCHCTYHFMNNPSFYVNTLQNKNAFHPATKGQHDLLFQKMKESGYKWENNQLEEINNKGVVDLGLPSGTLWATCNLGAEKETDFGMFFQWGDMKGYKGVDEHQFSWSDYKFGKHDSITKYNDLGNKLVLDNEDDPVFVATNGKQKMPTKEQLQELIDHTDQEWTNIDGIEGMKFINKEDDTKYIFIPAAGYCSNGSHYDVGYWGYAWSVSCEESYAGDTWYMGFNAGDVYMDHDNRCLGFSVRGVINR